MINKSVIAAFMFALPFASAVAEASDVKILCASGMREIVSELQPRLGQIVGQQVSIEPRTRAFDQTPRTIAIQFQSGGFGIRGAERNSTAGKIEARHGYVKGNRPVVCLRLIRVESLRQRDA